MQRNDAGFYGNETVNCDSCGGMFDPHNSPCEWLETKLVCGTCFHGYTEDELNERLE